MIRAICRGAACLLATGIAAGAGLGISEGSSASAGRSRGFISPNRAVCWAFIVYILPVPSSSHWGLIVRKRFNIRTYNSTLGLFLPPRIFDIVPADTPISAENCLAVICSDSIILANRSRSFILFNSRQFTPFLYHFRDSCVHEIDCKDTKIFSHLQILEKKNFSFSKFTYQNIHTFSFTNRSTTHYLHIQADIKS